MNVPAGDSTPFVEYCVASPNNQVDYFASFINIFVKDSQSL